MKFIKLCAVIIVAGASALSAFSFSSDGHEAIWILAKERLTPAAGAKVASILNDDSTEKTAAWADWVRLQETKPTKAFPHGKISKAEIKDVKKFPAFAGSDDWHFVDLPLGATEYKMGLPSTNTNDVVHGIETCIALLEKPDTTSNKIIHQRALRFLIHLVGDIHQPLHVACGYYSIQLNKTDGISDPAIIQSNHLPDDKGGNQLTGGSGNLHHIWDEDLPQHMDGAHLLSTAEKMSDFLRPRMASAPNWHIPGDYHHFAEAWASDAIPAARLAYSGLKIENALPHLSRGKPSGIIEPAAIKNFDESAYIAAHHAEVQNQLLKAAGRLADLLNAIKWAS